MLALFHSNGSVLLISPIFKKGSKHALGNYQLVSLTAIPRTIVESIIRDKMLKFAQENSLMTSDQHGFMKIGLNKYFGDT